MRIRNIRACVGLLGLTGASYFVGFRTAKLVFQKIVVPELATAISESIIDAAYRSMAPEEFDRFTDELHVSLTLEEAELRFALNHHSKKVN